jgi:hypothetical protein
LKVKAQGFRTYSAVGFDVNAAQVVTMDPALELGELQQLIEVSADAVILQTEAPVRSTTITTKQIDELPLASRNPTMLALTAPGVTSNKYTNPTGTFSVNGGRGRSNNFMIDGNDNNDISVAGQSMRIANPGSVAEVNVQTANYDAEFGRAGGAVINVITRGGSNEFHGTAGFVLDSTWDDAISSSFSNSEEVKRRGHNLPGTEQQFDGTFGGRLIRNRTFFHLSSSDGVSSRTRFLCDSANTARESTTVSATATSFRAGSSSTTNCSLWAASARRFRASIRVRPLRPSR